MDLHEDNQQNIVTATFEFPGVSKEDVKIDLHGEKLIVSAETKQSEEYAENGYTTRERRFGKYSRTLQLPQGTKVCLLDSGLSQDRVLTALFDRRMKSRLRWRTVS